MLRSAFIVAAALLFSSQLQAKTCELSIDSTDQMTFATKELKVEAGCTEVKLTLNHTGSLAKTVMGHNWVLSKTSDYQAIGMDAPKAGIEANYVPKDDARVIASTKIIGGGESDTITFSTAGLEKGGDYTFFCSFPGHWALMNGKLIVE